MTKKFPEAPIRDGVGHRCESPPVPASTGHPLGSEQRTEQQAGCQRQGPRMNTHSLTHLLNGGLLGHVVHHTYHICLWGSGTTLPGLPVHTTPALKGRTRHGSETRKPSFTGSLQLVLLGGVTGMVVCCANFREPFPAHFQVPALQLWSVSPLKGSGQTQPPQKLATPDLAMVLHSLSLWAKKGAENSTPGHRRSRRGTGQGCRGQLPPRSLAQTHVLLITGEQRAVQPAALVTAPRLKGPE